MGQAIGQVLSFGIGVALSPVPIIAVVLMLATPKGRVNGPAFLVGWIVGLAVVGTIVLLISSGASASSDGAPATWVSILKIVLGLLLVLLAIKQWRGRPRGDAEPELPAWMKTIDTFTPVKSAAMAVLLSAINPKNLLLTVGAAAAMNSPFGQAISGSRACSCNPARCNADARPGHSSSTNSNLSLRSRARNTARRSSIAAASTPGSAGAIGIA